MKKDKKITSKAMGVMIVLMLLILTMLMFSPSPFIALEGDYIDSGAGTGDNGVCYGMGTDGACIWVFDYNDGTVYKYDMNGSYIESRYIDSWDLTEE